MVDVTIIEQLQTAIKDFHGITRSNIVSILLCLMKIIENYDEITGEQKKAIILNIMEEYIDDNVNDKNTSRDLKLLVSLTLPSVIDTFISLDKHKIRIETKKIIKKVSFCCFKN